MTLHDAIHSLVDYAFRKHLIEESDILYSKNQLYHQLGVEPDFGVIQSVPLETLLTVLLDHAVKQNRIDDTLTERDWLDAKLMNVFLARPSEIERTFEAIQSRDIKKATDWFYTLMKDVNYIRTSRTDKNIVFRAKTPVGHLDITINVSKPEKDAKTIALEKAMPTSNYPRCLLCVENVGYAGRTNHPSRDNLRTIPLTLNQEFWHFQYSPYVYYNEHAIVFKAKHEPMQITDKTFIRLLDFVDIFPHYFIGSNADLPIVGGSILSHDHFQAGRHTFAIESSDAFYETHIHGVTLALLNWPLSTIRLQSKSREELLNIASNILASWRLYSDASVGILNQTDVMHNTITPICRKNEGVYVFDLILRNNRTDEAHPEGIFHPHRHLHHIKKENIGLIEAMGLAVLPARLVAQKADIKAYCLHNIALPEASRIHQSWAEELKVRTKPLTFENDFQEALGMKFYEVLKDAGVFKQTSIGKQAFIRFIQSEVLA